MSSVQPRRRNIVENMDANAGEPAAEDYFDERCDTTLLRRYKTKNTTPLGSYKTVNYAAGVRGGDMINPEYDQYNDNTEFNGHDETNGQYAAYAPCSSGNRNINIYDSENYLPQDMNSDWFDVMPEPISVKNKYLINVSRPIGVDTVSTTLKNPSLDLRGNPPCPKFVVSPWNQSSIEPDTNIKGLC